MRRSLGVVVTVLLAAGLTSGCKEVRLNSRCSSKDFAGSGDWVVVCKNGRWTRALTKAAAATIIFELIRQKKEAETPPPPPPPPPPLSTFVDGTFQVGTGSGQVPPGVYMAHSAGQRCGWRRSDAAGTAVGGDLFWGLSFAEIEPTDTYFSTTGGCQWIVAPPSTAMPANGDGTYRVGVEILPGTYRAHGGYPCQVQWLDSLDGSAASVILQHSGAQGPQVLSIPADVVAFHSQGCGPWLHLNTLPTAYVDTLWVPDVPGLSAGATWSQLDPEWSAGWSTTASRVDFSSRDLALWIKAGIGDQLAPGVYETVDSEFPPSGKVGFHPGGLYPSPLCVGHEVIVEIDSVAIDGGGAVTALDALVYRSCVGQLRNVSRIKF